MYPTPLAVPWFSLSRVLKPLFPQLYTAAEKYPLRKKRVYPLVVFIARVGGVEEMNRSFFFVFLCLELWIIT